MVETVAITGASGFIGKHLCLLMIEKKQRFKIFRRQSLQSLMESNTDFFLGISAVIHLAGKAHDTTDSHLTDYYKINTELTLAVADMAKKSGVKRFIFLSTIKVNGPYTLERPFSTSTPVCPDGVYAASKLKAEEELLKMHQPGVFEVVIIRPTLVYGTGVKANFLSLINLVRARIPLPFSQVNNKRSLLYVKNLTDLIYLCLSHPNAAGQIFSASDDRDLSLADIIKMISQGLHLRPLLFPIPVRLMAFAANLLQLRNLHERLFSNLHVDIEKTKNLLGWRPPYTVKQAFDEMLSTDY